MNHPPGPKPLLDRSRQPRAVAVSRSPGHGFSKQPVPSIRLLAGEGVEGDAHAGRTVQHLHHLRRDPTQPNLCQVHLFPEERVTELAVEGFPLTPGEIGENVLTAGLDLGSLPHGTLLRIGPEAVVQLTGLRTPCSRIDQHRAGLQEVLWGPRDRRGKRVRRAGVMSIVHSAGTIHPGDPITVELPPQPHIPLGPV